MPDRHEYRRLLAVVGLDRSDATVIRRALALAQSTEATLALLHIVEPDVSGDGGYPGPSPRQNAAAYEAEGLRRLTFQAAAHGAGAAECHARHGELRASLAQFAHTWGADLVIAENDLAERLGKGPWDVLAIRGGPGIRGGRRLGLWQRLCGLAIGQT